MKEGKNIIFLLLILAMLIPSGVIVARNLNVDPISTSLSEDNVLKVLFIIENDNVPISTNVVAHYSQTRRAAMFDIPANIGLILPQLGRTGGIQVGSAQVRLLGLGDLLQLFAGQRAHLLGVGGLRALVDLGSFLDQDGRRRRLHDEGEALVGKSGDDHGDRQTGLHALRLGVERLAELHDVQTALAQGRTDRGRGIGFACRNLQLDEADDFLGHEWLLL